MNTWGDIRGAFRDLTGDTGATIFTASQATAWANKALRDMAGETEYRDGVGTVAVTAGSTGAPVGTPLAVWRLECDDEALSPTTVDGLSRAYRNWFGYRGTPRHYYLDNTRGNETLIAGLYPQPSADVTVRHYTKAVPTAVSDAATATEIDVPDWAAGAVLYYMMWQAYRADTTVRNLRLAAFWEALYRGTLARLRSRSYSRLNIREGTHYAARMGMDVWSRAPEYITGTV